jgi:alanine-synthesizing transaminase
LHQALARLEIIADTALSVSAPAQLALPHVLGEVEVFLERAGRRLRHNLATLDQALATSPAATRLRCEGGWTAMLRLPATRSSEEWALHLLEGHGVLVQPGHFYDLSGSLRPDAYVVLSLLGAEAPFSKGASGLGVAFSG